jgi:hypothetical protein
LDRLIGLGPLGGSLWRSSRRSLEAHTWSPALLGRDEFDAGSFQGLLDFPESFDGASHFSGSLQPSDRCHVQRCTLRFDKADDFAQALKSAMTESGDIEVLFSVWEQKTSIWSVL